MNTEISVRVTRSDDAGLVTSVLESSYPVLMAQAYDQTLLTRALPRMTKANPSLLTSGTYYLAEVASGEVVGCGGWTPGKPGSGEVIKRVGHIRHFATHSDWASCGIGRAIYTECENQARTSGIESFECYSSLNASAFYEALGFVRIEHIDVPMGDGIIFPSILMQKNI